MNIIYFLKDPRKTVLAILALYLTLGFFYLGFNRDPFQVLYLSLYAIFLDLFFSVLYKKKLHWPLSALITSFSIALLLNYPHDYSLLFIPILFSIGSKYVLTFEGRHVFNPALIGVTLSIFFFGDMISLAPTYQWNGFNYMSLLMIALAILFLPLIRRTYLVISFLLFSCMFVFIRSQLMSDFIPEDTLFWGTISSPAFILFTFFMITDPKTSPNKFKAQIITGFSIALFDFIYHLTWSYYTLFLAAATTWAIKFLYLHIHRWIKREKTKQYCFRKLIKRVVFHPAILCSIILLAYFHLFMHKHWIPSQNISFKLESIDQKKSGIYTEFGEVFDKVDKRISHVAKWLLSPVDSISIGDYDRDGLPDIFMTNTLMSHKYRNTLYKNTGDFMFKKVSLALDAKNKSIEKYGLPTNALFVDYDNDKDLDIFVAYLNGAPLLLKNQLTELGTATFHDVSKETGLADLYFNSTAATFIDINKDGLLDIIITSNLAIYYPKLATERVNIFNIPKGTLENFNVMPENWSLAKNGGSTFILIQSNENKFILQDSKKWGVNKKHWSLSIGTGDFNKDNWTDFYIANDFGPDELYINKGGKYFESINGLFWGSIGKDTYKGMNVSVADLDNNSFLDIYVSNVHHPLMMEGSLLWSFDEKTVHSIENVKNKSYTYGILNENRHGWGAGFGDLNNDGLLDIVQTNGMISDQHDKKYSFCPDYWYVNEKLTRAPAAFQRNAAKWGDIRGACIMPNELDRVYLSQKDKKGNIYFVDAASSVGLKNKANTRGVAFGDLNNDGQLDLVISDLYGSNTIYKNTSKSKQKKRNWIGFELIGDGKKCNSQAIGSSVVLYREFSPKKVEKYFREINAASGHSAQSELRLHFGLGVQEIGELRLEVSWCNKNKVIYKNIKPNQYQKIYQDSYYHGVGQL